MSDPAVREIWFMKCSQVAATEMLLNRIGYFSHWKPSPHLLLQPTLEMAEDFSKDRVAPMIRDTAALTGLFGDPKSRTSGNTLRKKPYPGGQLNMAGSNSPASLASRPVRIFSGDECDRWAFSAGTEGDPGKLASKRMQTFYDRNACFFSSPAVKGTSKIEAGFLSSDQRYYHVPCHHCDEYQVLKWSKETLVWPKGKPHEAVYICEHCAGTLNDRHKHRMVRRGRWVPTREFHGIAGFHIWSAYSPWVSFAELATKWIDAQGDPSKLQVFVNTELGQTWEETGEQLDGDQLYTRREAYDLPAEVLVIVAGVDVQADRLELLIAGFGEGEESWGLRHQVFYGSPTRARIWAELDEALQSTFQHPSGAMLTIQATLIDSGYETDMVYDFVRDKFERNVFATKGVAGAGRPIITAPAKRKQGQITVPVHLFTVGTDGAKGLLYARLRESVPGPGYVHHNEQFELEWFYQLVAEQLKTRYVRGFPVKEWVKTRPRNEALDLWVLCLAGIKMLRPIWHTLAESLKPAPAETSAGAPVEAGGSPFHEGDEWEI